MILSPFDSYNHRNWPQAGKVLAETVQAQPPRKGTTHASRLIRAAIELMPGAAASFFPVQFGPADWAGLYAIVKAMTRAAVTLRDGSHFAVALLLEQKGLVGDRGQLERELFFSSNALKEAISIIQLQSRPSTSEHVRRWSQITFCRFCGRLVGAHGPSDPLCGDHFSDSRPKAITATFQQFEALRKQLYVELPSQIRPSNFDYGIVVALMANQEPLILEARPHSQALPISDVLQHFPNLSSRLATARIDISNTSSVLQEVDPIGADTYFLQRRAHKMIERNPSLACLMFCRAEARVLIATTFAKKRGGMRKGAGRKKSSTS